MPFHFKLFLLSITLLIDIIINAIFTFKYVKILLLVPCLVSFSLARFTVVFLWWSSFCIKFEFSSKPASVYKFIFYLKLKKLFI